MQGLFTSCARKNWVPGWTRLGFRRAYGLRRVQGQVEFGYWFIGRPWMKIEWFNICFMWFKELFESNEVTQPSASHMPLEVGLLFLFAFQVLMPLGLSPTASIWTINHQIFSKYTGMNRTMFFFSPGFLGTHKITCCLQLKRSRVVDTVGIYLIHELLNVIRYGKQYIYIYTYYSRKTLWARV